MCHCLCVLAGQLDSKTRLMFVPSKEKVAPWYVHRFYTIPLLDTHRQTDIDGQRDRETDGQTDGQEWTMVHNNVTFCMLTCDKTDER